MKFPIKFIATISLVALSSCSTVTETAAKMKKSTSKTFAAAKERTFGTKSPKLRLTKADPSRFLPEGTSAEKIIIKTTPSKASKQETRLLAKNTLPKNKLSSSQPSLKKTSKSLVKEESELPPLELPPLPAASTEDSSDFRGILPSLDGSNDATFIDIDGKALELPPMELPELEEEIDPEKSA